MSCGCSPTTIANDATCYAQTSGATIIQQIPEPTLKMYAASVGVPSTGPNAWVNCLVAAFLLTRRVIYFKRTPGDCGQNVPVNLGLTGQLGSGVSTAAVADPEPISKAILSGIATVFGIFGGAHAAAVKTEQQVLCDVATKYNGYAAAIEQALASGQLSVADASTALGGVVSACKSELVQIAKPCNAACGFKYALDALLQYNEDVVFPSLFAAPVQAVGAGPGAPGGGGVLIPNGLPGSSLSGAVNSLLGGNVTPEMLLLFGGLGLVIVKLL